MNPGSAQRAAQPPPGSIQFSATVVAPTSAHAIGSLATDLRALVEAEPALLHAQWLSEGPPRVGSRASVEAEIPFSVPVIRRYIGTASGTATLVVLDHPRTVAYTLEAARADGALVVDFMDSAGGCRVSARGWIWPHSPIARAIFRPIRGQLGKLADESVRRGILRAASATTARGCG